MRRTNSGVTLIALIITIIVLLILAGVTIAMVVGDNGVLNQAVNSRIQTDHASIKEAMDLAYSDYQLEFVNMYLEEGNSTRVASLSVVEVDRYALQDIEHGEFLYYMIYKGYINVDGVIDVENLVGSELSTGKGNIEEGTDIYVLEEIGNNYVVTYYDDNSDSEEIWRVSKYSTKTLEIKYVDTDEVAFEIEYIEGMTWGDWIESEFNIFGIYYNNRYVVYPKSSEENEYKITLIYEDGDNWLLDLVKDDDFIIDGQEYVLDNSPLAE